MDERWSDDTQTLVAKTFLRMAYAESGYPDTVDQDWGREDVDRDDSLKTAATVLAALADAGLLVTPGSESHVEWSTTLTQEDGGGWTNWPETARAWVRTDRIRWRKSSSIVRRTVHTGPWVVADG